MALCQLVPFRRHGVYHHRLLVRSQRAMQFVQTNSSQTQLLEDARGRIAWIRPATRGIPAELGGDMEDVMSKAQRRFRDKLQTHLRLVDELGEAAAWEASLEGYPERQKAEMGAFIDGEDLVGGLSKAIPLLAAMGIEMEIVDISNGEVDAALEILKTCPCLEASRACGLSDPCSSLCHLDVEASRRAFPGMQVSALSRRLDDGSCACIFKYERAWTGSRRSQETQTSHGERPSSR